MEHEVWRFWMTKLDASLTTSLPASDSGSAAVWGSKRINPRPQSCLCLTWSWYPSNDDDEQKRFCFNYVKTSLFLAVTFMEKITTYCFSTFSVPPFRVFMQSATVFLFSFLHLKIYRNFSTSLCDVQIEILNLCLEYFLELSKITITSLFRNNFMESIFHHSLKMPCRVMATCLACNF